MNKSDGAMRVSFFYWCRAMGLTMDEAEDVFERVESIKKRKFKKKRKIVKKLTIKDQGGIFF